MLKVLQSDQNKEWKLEELLQACDWQDQAIVVGAGQGLMEAGLITVKETVSKTVNLGSEGRKATEFGLLERRLWEWVNANQPASMAALQNTFERHEAGPGVGLLKRLGIELISGVFEFTNADDIMAEIELRSNFLNSLPQDLQNLDQKLVEHFKNRRNFIEVLESKLRTWKINQAGINVPAESLIEVEMINEITPELLQSEDWKTSQFKPFDVTLNQPLRGQAEVTNAGAHREN